MIFSYNNLCKIQADAIYLYIEPFLLEFIKYTCICVYAIEKNSLNASWQIMRTLVRLRVLNGSHTIRRYDALKLQNLVEIYNYIFCCILKM